MPPLRFGPILGTYQRRILTAVLERGSSTNSDNIIELDNYCFATGSGVVSVTA